MRPLLILATIIAGVVAGKVGLPYFERHVQEKMTLVCEERYRSLLPISVSDEIWSLRASAWLPIDEANATLDYFSSQIVNPWETILADRFYTPKGLPAGRTLFRWGFDEGRKAETWKVMVVIAPGCTATDSIAGVQRVFQVLFDYEHPQYQPSERHPLGTLPAIPRQEVACTTNSG